MAAVLTCAQLKTQVTNDVTTWFPPVIQLAIQVFAVAPMIGGLVTGGFVYSANYGGVAPAFSPGPQGAIAIDSVTRRKWNWNGTTWS